MVDRLYLTVVDHDFGADTFFPDYSSFKVVEREERNDFEFPYEFLTLDK